MSIVSTVSEDLARIPGLAMARRTVAAVARPDSGAHAVLLFGALGCGKRELAHSLAQAWLCVESDPPCGKCPACKTFDERANPDALIVRPQGKSSIIQVGAINEERGAPNDDGISIDRFLRTLPILSKHKVVLIESAHRFSPQAANALLKSLEEPAPYAKFVLTTSAIGRVSPTIRSRCLLAPCEGESGQLGATLGDRLTPGLRRRFEARENFLARIDALAEDIAHGPAGGALRRSDRLRELCSELADAEGMAARQAQTDCLGLLAEALALRSDYDAVGRIAAAHTRIEANGAVGLVFDAAMMSLDAR